VQTLVLYNGSNPFAGLSPTPFIGKSDSMVRFHDRWAVASTITLQGSITGLCPQDAQDLIDKQKLLLQRFSEDFKTLSIQEENQTIYSAPYCTIKSINFPSSKYVRLLPYEITIDCYQQNLFSGVYGISEPKQEINWSENDDSTVTVTRSLSAKGFNTNSNNRTNNALENATSWVKQRTGWNQSYFSEALPAFITYNSAVNLCPKKISENIDRLTATYSIEEEYIYNPAGTSSSLLKYSTDISYDLNEGIYSVQIQGSLEGCPEISMGILRSNYKNIDLYSIANYEYLKTNRDLYTPVSMAIPPSLNPEFLSEQINETSDKKIISFSKSWDTDPRAIVLFEYDISYEENLVEDSRIISIQGSITARGDKTDRYAKVLDYFKTKINLFRIAQDFYLSMGFNYGLVQYPSSLNVTEDIINGTIEITVSYSDKIQPPPGFEDWEYTVDVELPINQYVPVPVLCGSYVIIDTKAKKRGRISVNSDIFSLSNDDKRDIVRTLTKQILSQNIPIPNRARVVKEDNVSYLIAPQGKRYSVSESETFEGEIFSL